MMKHFSISDAEHFLSPKLGPGALGNRLLPVNGKIVETFTLKINKCVIKNKNKIALVCHVQQAR